MQVLLCFIKDKKPSYSIKTVHRAEHQHKKSQHKTKWRQIWTNVNVNAHKIKVYEVGGKYKYKFKYIQIKKQIYTNINSAVLGKPFAI